MAMSSASLTPTVMRSFGLSERSAEDPDGPEPLAADVEVAESVGVAGVLESADMGGGNPSSRTEIR